MASAFEALQKEIAEIRKRHDATTSGAPYDVQATMYTDISLLFEEIDRLNKRMALSEARRA